MKTDDQEHDNKHSEEFLIELADDESQMCEDDDHDNDEKIYTFVEETEHVEADLASTNPSQEEYEVSSLGDEDHEPEERAMQQNVPRCELDPWLDEIKRTLMVSFCIIN